MVRASSILLLGLLVVPASAVAQACTPPLSSSIRSTDQSLSDWMVANECMWQGTDASGDQSGRNAGSDILGFAVTHSASVDDNPNHFWFMRLRGAVQGNRTYRIEFTKPGTTVDMDMTCPSSGDPRVCTLACSLNGMSYTCASTTVRAYSIAGGQWVIESMRQSPQLFFDSTEGTSVVASVYSGQTVYDSTAPIVGYHSNGFAGATAVTLKTFVAGAMQGGGMDVRWETAAEHGTLGFYLRRGSANGPRVNAKLVRGQLTSPVGAAYALIDPKGTPATTYFLEEISLEGTHFYGPAKRSSEADRFAARPPLRLAVPPRMHRLDRSKAARGADQVFADVREQGLYRLSAGDFGSLHGARLSFEGDAIPAFRLPNGDLLFYAPTPDSAERSEDAYEIDRARPGRPGRVLPALPAPRAMASKSYFKSTLHVEEHHIRNVTAADATLRFPWGMAVSGAAPSDFDIEIPHYVGGSVLLTLNLVGLSDFGASVQHHAVLEVNGQAALEAKFGGHGLVSYTVTVPDGVIHAGVNALSLGAIADLGLPYDLIALSSVDVTYSRAYMASGNALELTADGRDVIQLDGFSAEPAILDLTNPSDPILITDARSFSTPQGVAVRFRHPGASGQRRYFAAVPKDAAVRPSRAGEVPVRGGDYVAIVGEGLATALQPLLDKRAADGRKVVSVAVEALYDRFGHGQHGPQALRAYLNQLVPAPHDVLLVGKPSVDPHDYLGTGIPDLVPTSIVSSDDLDVSSPSDAALVAGEDGRTPIAAVGRLPVLTEQELTAWVTKILQYERSSAKPSNLAVFAADDHNPSTGLADSSFKALSDQAAARMAPMKPIKVYLPEQNNASLLSAFAQSPGLVVYHGHGGAVSWSSRLLPSSDMTSLPAARPFFLLSVDCWDGQFAMPSFMPIAQSFAEAPQGGAIATFSPGTLVAQAHDPLVDEIIFTHLSSPDVLTAGELARRSHAQMATLVGPAKDLVFVYNLIGDPAVRLPFK